MTICFQAKSICLIEDDQPLFRNFLIIYFINRSIDIQYRDVPSLEDYPQISYADRFFSW